MKVFGKLFRAAAFVAALASIVFFAAQAIAIEIDFGAVLTDQDDKPLIVDDKPLTLGRAAMVGLVTPQPDEQGMSAEEKYRKGQLAMKVYRPAKVELSVEDVAQVKKYIGKTYGPLVVFRAFPLLDPIVPR